MEMARLGSVFKLKSVDHPGKLNAIRVVRSITIHAAFIKPALDNMGIDRVGNLNNIAITIRRTIHCHESLR